MVTLSTPILPFSFVDGGAVSVAFGIAVIAFFVMRFFTRDIMVNELDLFVMTNVTMAFSVALVFSYWRAHEMWSADFVLILGLMSTFYVSVFLTGKLLGIKALKDASKVVAFEAMRKDHYRNVALVVTFVIGVPALTAITLASLRAGFDSQFAIERDAGPFRLLMEGGVPLFLYYAFSTNIVTRKFCNVWMVGIVLLVSPLGGAKSALLVDLLTYFTVAGLLRPEIEVKRLVKLSPVLALALPTMLIPFIVQGLSISAGLFQSSVRFFLSGDIYYYTFVASRPTEFFHYYQWWSYLLHPFLRLVGQRAYRFPLGSILYSHYIGQQTVSGPNPHATVLGFVLFNGNVLLAVAFCSLIGVLTVVMRYWAFRINFVRRLPPVLRSTLSAILAFNSPILLLDFGTAERYLIAGFFVMFSIWIVCLLLEEMGDYRHDDATCA